MAKYARLWYICTTYESLKVADLLLGYEIKVTFNIIIIIIIAFWIHESRIYFELMAKNPMNYRFWIGEILLSDGGV